MRMLPIGVSMLSKISASFLPQSIFCDYQPTGYTFPIIHRFHTVFCQIQCRIFFDEAALENKWLNKENIPNELAVYC